LILGVENKVSRGVLSQNYLGPQKKKENERKEKGKKESKHDEIKSSHSICPLYLYFLLTQPHFFNVIVN